MIIFSFRLGLDLVKIKEGIPVENPTKTEVPQSNINNEIIEYKNEIQILDPADITVDLSDLTFT